jgi:hypothetical protein
MAKPREKTPDYRAGYKAGYIKGKREAEIVRVVADVKKASWIMDKNGWHCSNCGTKHNQAHDEFCCKCGAKMNEEEADYEDNEVCVSCV